MGSTAGPQLTDDGLIFYLDAASSSSYDPGPSGSGTSWYDISVNGRVSTLYNGTSFSSSNLGHFIFDGTNDYVEVQNSATQFTFPDTVFTVSMWVKTISNSGYLIAQGATATTGGWSFELFSNGKIGVITKDSRGYISLSSQSTNALNDGQWHNVLANFTTSTWSSYRNISSLYIDGVFNTTVYGNDYYDVSYVNINIGRRTTGGYFNGSISNVLIYNRILSTIEVAQNYNAIKSRYKL